MVGCLDQWQQVHGQYEVAQIVHHENFLEPIDQFEIPKRTDASVENQHIQLDPHCRYRGGAVDGRLKVR